MIGRAVGPTRRHLFNALALASLVLYLLTMAALARSLRRSDQFTWRKVEDAAPARYQWYLLVVSGRGGLALAHDAEVYDLDAARRATFAVPPAGWEYVGHASARPRYPRPPFDTRRRATGGFWIKWEHTPSVVRRELIVPYWAPAVATGALPALWLVRRRAARLRRRRTMAGLCTECGYDLRASGDTCPECGAPARGEAAARGIPFSSSGGRRMNNVVAVWLVFGASLATALAVAAPAAARAVEPPTPRPLWPEGAPGAQGKGPADVPTITVYPAPAGGGKAAAVVVCPGGGYGGLAAHEAEPVAQWLNTLGVTGVVLRYRHGPRYGHPVPLADARRAIRTVRHRAAEWNVDPNRVGVLGFSAGGHLAATASTQFDAGDPNATDPIERQSSRPDVSVLVYPVITMTDPHTHAGSRRNLLGEKPTGGQIEAQSAEKNVTKDTPPAFLFHTADDAAVPVENALAYAGALRRHGVPFELHVYEKGRHGVGLATDDPVLGTWPARCADWLAAKGFGGKKTRTEGKR